MPDAEPEQQPRSVGAALGLDRCQQVVHRLVLPALAADQLGTMVVKAENVARPLCQPSKVHVGAGQREALLLAFFGRQRGQFGEMRQ